MSPFLSAYFARIDWHQPAQADIDTLRALHLQHNSAIPFENIDVVLPREIHLDDQNVADKLIAARRGGYCFEQNGLFERVLREMGFHVRSVLGRVVLSNPPQMPPRTHRLLLVELNGERWIADVGFGGQTLTAPIRLIAGEEQATPHGLYRLINEGNDWVLQFRHHDHWQSMYHFDLVTQYFNDYVMGNFWSAHWPQSHFRHHLLMCRHLLDGGKLTLTNFHFTHWQGMHVVEQRNLADTSELYQLMQERFGLGVDDAKHGFSLAELTTVMAGFDTHPQAGNNQK
ncbi:N-hydroxyarylamine O-acetyltransferase [Lelliottia amnigena]|uniref:N-hydroxyarylamine O-acetyltransferase n=1 Tax=Lelliottia amnigena TaxID=61646 RepID=A0ABU7UCX5_LELAM